MNSASVGGDGAGMLKLRQKDAIDENIIISSIRDSRLKHLPHNFELFEVYLQRANRRDIVTHIKFVPPVNDLPRTMLMPDTHALISGKSRRKHIKR